MNTFKLALTASLLMCTSVLASAQAKWETAHTWHLGGEGAWDYVAIDPATHRVFLTRSTHTEILDEITGKVLGDIPGQVRSHGVAIVPSLNRGFITDGGGSGAIVIFDLTTYATLGKLAALPDADGIIYDPGTQRIFAVSGDGNALLTFKPDVDPKSGKIDPPIALGGSPEFLATDGSGKVFINIEDKDLVAAVDVAARKVVARWPVAPGGHPVGLAIDPAQHLLFIGCRKPQQLIAMSTTDGKIVGAVAIPAGNDATAFFDGQAFASTGDGTLVVAREIAGKLSIEQLVKTSPGARTLGIDPLSHKIFLPTAEFEPGASAGARPKAKPDSFMLIEVGHRAE